MNASANAWRLCVAILVCAATLAGCDKSPPPGYQGYVEGEFVNVSSPIAGRLDQLLVKRGDEVAVGAPLFALESANEAGAVPGNLAGNLAGTPDGNPDDTRAISDSAHLAAARGDAL